MTKIYEKYSLKELNSFKVDVYTDYYVAPKSLADIREVISDNKYEDIPKLILGGGSNMLFTGNFKGLIIHPQIIGISIESDTENYVIVKVGAAVIWDVFVNWSVEHNYGGIENLSLIPGTVGASPVQNIGAYGVEVKDTIYEVHAIKMDTGKHRIFNNEECKFNYRESIFKNKLKNQYLITHVYFKLSKKANFKLEYGNIQKELNNFEEVNLKTIRQAVINIRESKLPDPEITPNAGSFFKNPVVTNDKFQKLIKQFPDIANYPIDKDNVKLAAGWLIDHLGWKGEIFGRAGVHKNQALVLVNMGDAKGEEIIGLANKIRMSVLNSFGIDLNFEVNVY
ncbi:MAG: UDP-N-acetylmuramate dehydrogenase [Bacteroidota bacterium]